VDIPPEYDEAINIQESTAGNQPSSGVAAATYVDSTFRLFLPTAFMLYLMFNFTPIYSTLCNLRILKHFSAGQSAV